MDAGSLGSARSEDDDRTPGEVAWDEYEWELDQRARKLALLSVIAFLAGKAANAFEVSINALERARKKAEIAQNEADRWIDLAKMAAPLVVRGR